MLEKNKFFVEDKTFRSKKNFAFLQNSIKRDQLKDYLVKTLGGATLKDAVKLPVGQDRNEWLAINTVDFFNQINLLYGTISEFCTNQSCPIMSAGKKYEYLLWADATKGSKPTAASAPEYVSKLLEWIEEQLDNESVFPSDSSFPANFESTVIKTIFKRMFRVYAHVYYSHMEKIEAIGEDAHLNTCFKHFMYFVKEFDLVDEQEQKPLAHVIEQIFNGKR